MSEKINYQQTAWKLDDLFKTFEDPAIEETYKKVDAMVTKFEEYRDQLKPEIPTPVFMTIVESIEAINKLGIRIGGFAELAFSGDTQSQKAQIAIARFQQFSSEMENRTLFFSLWWKALDDENAKRLMAASGDYRYWLQQMRNFKDYTLTEPEEKIVNIKDVTGSAALNMLYDSITNRYTFKVNVEGEDKDLTRGELMALTRQTDPDLRKRAFQALYSVYGNDGPILGQIYQAIVRDWKNENVGLRGFSSPMSVRNLVNDIPDKVIDTLLDVTRKNTGIFHRFFALKAKILGMEKLRRYDIYASISKSDKTYSFNEATEITFDAFKEFDEGFAAMAERVLKEEHLDSEIRKGKMSGAFCATIIPELTPWVLLNYQGKADDVATLAHELGHAIHSMMAEDHTYFTQHACLPLAETASTFGEMVLTERLMSLEKDKNVQRDILFRQMDDAFATILRQIYFSLFERQAHDMIVNDASIDELSAAYMENLKEEFGDSVEISDEFRWEWVSIPHIYNVPFYVYAYAFGQLLVFALYKQFKVEGESFKPRYMKILSSGGSVAPLELLADAGIDITQESFWQGGYDVIDEMVKKLELLA
ncbi:MAG: M3 family oligoendopeptidase [Anaerolineaceae bacterium]|nr:M3 family oligoendopeptidase [Anaerolineaceae bacterium]